jgi:membrane protein YqaA with SNARE-associated domain
MDVQPWVSLIFSFFKSPAPAAHHSTVLRWLTHLGVVGVLLAAAMDASVIPLPVPGTTDLLLLWLVSHRGNPWILVSCAVAASMVGGFTSWRLGKTGGEAALERYVPARLLGRTTRWVQRHPILSVFLPAILPPPIPLSPFLLAAGALGVSWRRFLLVFGVARTLRYGLVAWLAVVYGRRVIRLWSGTLEKWSGPLVWTFAVVMVGGIAYGIWKLRRKGGKSGGKRELEAARAD